MSRPCSGRDDPGRKSSRRSLNRCDRGAATVFLLCAMALLGLVTTAVTLVASVEKGRDRVAAAADAAALAGAIAVSGGSAEPCAAAAALAEADGATLVSCVLSDSVVTVRVAVAMPPLARWGAGSVSMTARAGPAS